MRMETLVAAAGVGKSYVVGALADAWTGTGRRVVGLAPPQVAAEVLADEGLVRTANVERWLGTQRRLDAATPERPGNAGDEGSIDPSEGRRIRIYGAFRPNHPCEPACGRRILRPWSALARGGIVRL